MSYCRFGRNSDVYMYEHVDGFIECCACNIGEPQTFNTPRQAIMHLFEHLGRGDKVPMYAYKQLIEEMRDGILPQRYLEVEEDK